MDNKEQIDLVKSLLKIAKKLEESREEQENYDEDDEVETAEIEKNDAEKEFDDFIFWAFGIREECVNVEKIPSLWKKLHPDLSPIVWCKHKRANVKYNLIHAIYQASKHYTKVKK